MPSATPIPLPSTKSSSKGKSASKLAKPAKSKAVTPSKKTALSAETVIDSSDEDMAEAPSVKVSKKSTSAQAAPVESDSSESEDSSSESESTSESDTAAPAVAPTPSQQLPKSVKKARAASPVATAPDALRETHATQELRPAKPYIAPSGYKQASSAAKSSNLKLLDRSALAGKQLWYFSAPASVDLSELKELSAEQLKGTKAVFKQDDGEYTLNKEPLDSSAEVQIMLLNGEHFTASSTQILASYKLQHKVTIPSSTAGPTSHHAYAKPKRQQPTGLRTRWRPAGARNSDADDSDGDIARSGFGRTGLATQARPQAQGADPATVATSTPSKKRKERDGEGSERKKDRKRKKEAQKQAEAAAASIAVDDDLMDVDIIPIVRSNLDRSTSEVLKTRDELAGRTTAALAQPSQDKEKKKKKKSGKVEDDPSVAVTMNGHTNESLTNGITPVPLPELPAAESTVEKKKKKEKDKTKEMSKEKVKIKESREKRPEITL